MLLIVERGAGDRAAGRGDFHRVAAAERRDRVAEAVGDGDVGFDGAAVAQAVMVQVKRQVEPMLPALTVTLVRASFAAAAVPTVIVRPDEVEIEPSVAAMLAASTLLSFITPFFEEATSSDAGG